MMKLTFHPKKKREQAPKLNLHEKGPKKGWGGEEILIKIHKKAEIFLTTWPYITIYDKADERGM